MSHNVLSAIIYWVLLLSVFTDLYGQSGEPEYGKAAFYADKFQGRKTASGELYDKKKMTCAHKTYPFGTLVRVTRVDNNRSVVVKVNDRGPFHEGYVVDLSRAAAAGLDMVKSGKARVKVELVQQSEAPATAAPAPATSATNAGSPAGEGDLLLPYTGMKTNSTTNPAIRAQASPQKSLTANAGTSDASSQLFQVQITPGEKKGFAVQLAYLSTPTLLLQELSKLVKKYPGKVLIAQLADGAGNTTGYKLLVGPYPDKDTALKAQKSAASKGYPKSYVVSLGEL